MEECIQTQNANGECLRGIIHHGNPDNYKKIILICLNTGLNDMVGWHRIQVKTARYLAKNGYTTIRYDDTGIGDSDGLINEESVVEIFTQIETGLFIQNANAVTEFVRAKFQNHKIIYIGFCGGGLTAIFSAAINKLISGTVIIGAPVTLSSNEYFHKRDAWVVQKNVEKYKSKLFDLKAWLRFFTLRGEYKTVFFSLLFFLKHKFSGIYSESIPTATEEIPANLNQEFFSVFRQFIKRKIPCLFFYAENDSATWEFKKYFLSQYEKKDVWVKNKFTFFEAEKANHILSSEEAQGLLNDNLLQFLSQYR